MWAFQLLGLSPDADERSIKRAYAQRLRTTRPHEDPAGFQRLREAYELALRLCKHRTVDDPQTQRLETETMASPALPPTPAPSSAEPPAAPDTLPTRPRPVATVARTAAPLPAPVVDLERLLDELLSVAERGHPEALLQWLGSRHELWSLHAKAALGQRMMARLHQRPAAMPGECFDALLRFFDLDHVRAGYDPFALQRLRRRMRLTWEMQPEHIEALAMRAHDPAWPGRAPNVKMTRRMLQQLSRPFRWWQALSAALLPERPGELARFAERLSEGHVEELLPYLPQAQLRFWLQAGERVLSLPRFAVNAVRIVAGTAVAIAIMAVLFEVITLTGGNADKAWDVFPTISAWIAGIAGLAFAYMGWQWLDYFQRLPESAGQRWAWLRWLCIPLIAALALALKYLGVNELAGDLVVILAIVLAVRRYRERSGAGPFRIRIHPIGWIVAINVLRPLLASSGLSGFPLVELGACIALGFWAADAWKERERRRPSRAAA